jgi:hypothetical protein
MNRTLNRRTVLRAAGAVVALPFLEIMRPSPILARSISLGPKPALPHRVAFFYSPNGMHMPGWLPATTGRDFDLPETLAPLAGFRSQLNVLSGLTLDGARDHGDGPGDHARAVASFLTGAHPFKTDGAGIRNGVSIDQLLVEKTLAGESRLPSLEVGMEASAPAGQCDSGYSCVYTSNISWRTETTPVAKEINPAALFDRIFGGEEEQENRTAAERRRKYRKSILDAVRAQAGALQQQLGSDDRRKLDEYLYSVRDVEKRLAGSEKLDRPELDASNFSRPAGVPRAYAEHMNLLFDVMALAWQTDSTRVLTFMLGNAGSNRSYRDIGITEGHHDLSHHGNSEEKQQKIKQINLYHMQLFAGFLKRLADVEESDGTLLDNSFIVYGSGIADGNQHSHHGLPLITVGSGGGLYETGQHHSFRREMPLTNLYQTILQQVGVGGVNVGDSNGVLDELTRT